MTRTVAVLLLVAVAGAAGWWSRRDDAVGELTVHGVTQPVTQALQSQLVDRTAVIVGSTDLTFADHGVSVPEAPLVPSASGTGTLVLQLSVRPS